MSLLDDLRAALRSLARRPGFAAVVALTLSVALGANTAVFSVLQQTVLRPVPHPGAEDAVYITREAPQGNLLVNPTFEQYRSWKRHAETLADMEAFDTRRVTLLGGTLRGRGEEAGVCPEPPRPPGGERARAYEPRQCRASLALGRLVESQLHDVPARDPAVLAAAAGVLAFAAVCATLLPAVRAAKLDPARVLRDE